MQSDNEMPHIDALQDALECDSDIKCMMQQPADCFQHGDVIPFA